MCVRVAYNDMRDETVFFFSDANNSMQCIFENMFIENALILRRTRIRFKTACFVLLREISSLGSAKPACIINRRK